jgi:LysM repeat protein
VSPRVRPGFAHYAAPVAFLLGVTIAVLLIRSGLESHGGRTASTPVRNGQGSPVAATTTRSNQKGTHYVRVGRGDTFGSIAARAGTTVAALERLNPGVTSTSLQVGQRLRVH